MTEKFAAPPGGVGSRLRTGAANLTTSLRLVFFLGKPSQELFRKCEIKTSETSFKRLREHLNPSKRTALEEPEQRLLWVSGPCTDAFGAALLIVGQHCCPTIKRQLNLGTIPVFQASSNHCVMARNNQQS